MKVGLIADTHDELGYAEPAMELFAAQRCSCIIHCGDIEQPETLTVLAGARSNADFLWILGSHDLALESELRAASDAAGARCLSQSRQCEGVALVGAIRIGVLHNPYGGIGAKRPFLLERWSRETCDGFPRFHLIVYGHFHYFNIKYSSPKAPTAVVCPGGCREDVVPRSIAIFDTDTWILELYALRRRNASPALAFATNLRRASSPDLQRGPGLDDHFVAGVSGNLSDRRRDYWQINDRWGAEWLEDWLDPRAVLSLA